MNEQQLTLPLGQPPGAPIWDPAVLETLAELNEQMLRTLSTAARGEPRAPLLRELASSWDALDDPARALLAAGPMLLIDAGLAEPLRWRGGIQSVRDEARAGRGNPYFHDAEGVALMRRVLVLAWHLARANPLVGRVVLGMTAACSMRLASCRLHELEQLAEQQPEWITPRWEHQPQFWRQMLNAAVRSDRTLLRQLRWRGVQLLAASLQTQTADAAAR